MNKLTQGATRLLVLALGLGLVSTVWAAAPVVVWDGRHADYKFSTLTRGDYTIGNIGSGYANSVASDGSYLQIGNEDAKAAITLKRSDNSQIGASTVIIRCENMQADNTANRAVLSLLNGSNPYVGVAQERYHSNASSFIWNNGIWSDSINVAAENAFSGSGENSIAFAYSAASGSAYYVNGVLRCASSSLKAGSYSPDGVVIGGVGADGSGAFYAMKGMKITAIAFFNSHISSTEIAAYMFPSEAADAYTATVSSSTSWGEIAWDGGKTWSGDTSSATVNLVIESGVTVTAPVSLNASKLVVTGAGTLTFAQGENTLTVGSAAINAKVDLPSGVTLKTVGDVGFYSESNEFEYGSLLEVVSGEVCATTYCSSYSGGFAGTLTIDPDGTFTLLRTDTLKRNSNQVVINVYGIMSFIGNRWTVQSETRHQINLYPGSKVVGVGDGNGVFDFETTDTSIIVHNTNKSGDTVSGGVVTIDAPVRMRTSGANTTVNVASGTKLVMKKSPLGNGSIVKTGEGTLEFGAALSRPLTINNGSVVATAMPTGNVTINSDTTFTLQDVAWTSGNIFSGSGTLELLSTTGTRTHTMTDSSFNGIVKLSNTGSQQCNLNPNGAATFTTMPELVLNADKVHLGDGYYRQQGETHGSLDVRDVSGSGWLYAVWGSNVEYEYLLRTKQTKDTRFSGYIYSNTANNGNRRWINLDVVGDGSGTVNSLTLDHGLYLQGTTDTSEQASTLSISNDAKVVFGSSGTWATGKVIVGEDGWLQSGNNAAVKNLTLHDGANLVFPTASSSLNGITNLAFSSGTTCISFADEVTPTAGTLIDWSGASLASAPAGTFQLVGSVAGDWILAKSETGLSLTAAAAKVTPTTGDPVAYASVEAALSAYATLIGTDEGATMAILDGTTLTEQDVTQLAQVGIYYDSSSGVLTKAVAKVGQTCYPSLSAAISDGAAITLLRASNEAIALNVAITLTETASYSGTLSGSGTLTLTSLRSSALVFGEWTGTVVLPNVNGTEGGFRFDYYGKAGSTIKIENGFSGWLNTAEDARQVKANLIVNSAFTISGTNSGTWYNFAKMSGTGNFSLIQSNAPSGFHILVLEDYSGTLSNTIGSGTPTALTVSRLNLASAPVAGQKLVNTTTPNAVNLEAVYVGDAVQSVTLAKGSDGIYAALVSVTKGDNPTTYYATVSDAMTAAGSDAATITLLGNTDSNVSLAVGQSLVTGGFSVGTVSPTGSHVEMIHNGTTYTAVDNSTNTWKSTVASGSWNDAANWENGVVPTNYTAVTFPAGDYRVNLRDSGDQVGAMTVNGNVTFRYATDDYSKWPYLEVYGDISGSGSIKIFRAGLQANYRTVNVSCDFIVDSPSNAYVSNQDSFITGNSWDNNGDKSGWSFTKSVTVISNAYFKADEATRMPGGVTIACPFSIGADAAIKLTSSIAVDATAGTTTMNGNFGAYDTGTLTFGAVTVAETMNFPDTDKLAFAGVVTVNDNVALTLAASPTYTSASFVLAGTGSTLIDANGVASGKVSTTVANYCVKYTEATTTYSVEVIPSSVEIGAATFEYGVDFTNATVTVAVTETNASDIEYTLTIGGKDYTANADGGTTVTFNNVEVPRGAAYGSVSYDITSTASSTTGATSGSATVADVTADWINERAASATGTSASAEGAGGTWTNAVTYTDGKAAISDNRFVATAASTASRVVLEFEVCFSSTSEDDVSGEAQAAIKLGDENSVTTFKVLAPGNTWTPVSNAELPIDASATYDVVLTIDYGTSTYKVDVEGKSLTNSAGVASFSLATNKAAVQNIDFVGSGTLTSMKGDQLEGYMVKDALNHFYATIEAATQAYNSANGPYTVLHDGTAPSGWKIDNATKKLIKIAKGLFFMAY